MKIGLNARFLAKPYTGIGKYTYQLLSALSEQDKQNNYFLFTPQLVDFSLPDNFRQIRVPEKDFQSASLRKFHWEHKLLPREFEKWGIDLAHYLYPSNPNKRQKIPTIVTVHDAIPWRLKYYNTRLRSKAYHMNAKSALKKADHLITVSDFSRQELKSLMKIEDKNISVTHLASNFGHLKAAPQEIDLRRRYLIYVGGYDMRKNVPMLMMAYQKFIANHYPIDLILVNGKNKGLENFFTDEFTEKIGGKFPVKPKGKIIMTDPLSDQELATLYRKALLMVHPSTYEGFNLPLVEAIEHELPMLVADIPVNREVAGGAAYFADISSEDAFGIALHEMLNNASMQRELKQAASQRRQDFNWAKTAEQTLDVYKLFM